MNNLSLRAALKKIGNKFNLSNVFILLLINILFLTACSSPNSPSANSSNSATSKTLRLLYWQAPTILNPHLANGTKDFEGSRITYEPLASYDKDGKLILFLAAEIPTQENGGIAKDGKSVTWKLKQGVKWSDGKPFTSADVVFTYQYFSNPDTGSTTNRELLKNVEAIDDYTVKITFKDVNPAWSETFVGENGMILPKHIFEKYNGTKSREAPANLIPVGTGPYKVVQFKPGDIVVYEPNPFFREADKVFFERIELKGGGDATSAARAVLQTQDADYAWNVQVEALILKQLQASGKGTLASSFGGSVERILINFTDPNKATPEGERSSLKFPHPFFSEKKVRQAFSYAIDRDNIAERLYGATGKATANILVAPEIYKSTNNTYEFNLEKAASLLDEAGWKDSNGNGIRDKNGTEMKVVFQTSVNPVRQKTQEVVKQALTSLGVGVELKNIDGSIFFSNDPANPDTINHFYADMEMFTNGNTNPDPGVYMKRWTCDEIAQKSNNWSKTNYPRYCNPKYDALWKQSTNELDAQKRQQLFIQMNDLLIDDVVMIPVVARADVIAVGNSLVGVDLTPWDSKTWNIKDWRRK